MTGSPSPAGNGFLRRDRPAEGVLRLTMDRPERRNALSTEAMQELLSAIDEADADPSTRCILLAAEGPVFSAGHDLRELGNLQESQGCDAACLPVFELCSRLMVRIVRSGTPVVAVVQGLATAAGCQLVASCDLAVASTRAAFATPGVDIGLFCSTPSVALARAVPRKAAMEMLLTGERVGAERALALGLVNRVVEPGELDEVALDLARTIASKPADTVARGKADVHRQIELGVEEAYAEMSRAMAASLAGNDAREGIGAFLAKRHPRWNATAGKTDAGDE